MYKLLLATQNPGIVEVFQNMNNWQILGFRTPRIAATASEAINSLQKHHADGIAIALPDDETAVLQAFLTENYPLLPILRAGTTREEVTTDVNDLYTLLGRVYEDNADERYDPMENMRRIRHAFFRQILSGKINSPDAIHRRLQLLRSRMDQHSACVLISFSLPTGDGYLSGHWHYGPDRLQVAMRNLFGAELNGMRLLVSVLEDDRIYLLACPMIGCEALSGGESMTGLVAAHAQEAIVHVHEYLGIDMQIASIDVLPNVTSFADSRWRNHK